VLRNGMAIGQYGKSRKGDEIVRSKQKMRHVIDPSKCGGPLWMGHLVCMRMRG
jgi:hypothetical protein